MNPIKWIEIDGEEVAVKKGVSGYRILKLWKNKDGTTNWFNLFTGGSWFNLITIVIFVCLILLAIYEYSSNMNTLMDCFSSFDKLEICKRSFMPDAYNIFTP